MIPHEVVQIIGQPVKMERKIDYITVVYWRVPVVLKLNYDEHESAVTFETFEEANKLQIGDVFLR